MALNKQQTSMMTKVFIWMLIIAFVGSMTAVLANGLIAGSSTTQTAQTDSLATIATKYKPQIDSDTQKLAANPKDYATLVDLGNTYSNWTFEVLKASPNSGAHQPIALSSASFYRRALAIKPGDPSVSTDFAIVTFYSGDSAEAIATVEQVMRKNPKFAPGFFNAGIFYEATGQTAKALAAFQTDLKLDPNDQQTAPIAKEAVTRLLSPQQTPNAPATSSK